MVDMSIMTVKHQHGVMVSMLAFNKLAQSSNVR